MLPSGLALQTSQRPHPNCLVQKWFRFEDHIDVFLGDEETLDMQCIHVAQTALRNWY